MINSCRFSITFCSPLKTILESSKPTCQLQFNNGILKRNGSTKGGQKTHFGFETVSTEEKVRKVQDVFSSVASKYDVMNDAMSAGIHRSWKNKFINILNPYPGTRLLDVAGGTGDIAFKFCDRLKYSSETSSVVVCDINPEMIAIGKERAKRLHADLNNRMTNIEWVEGDAQNLPFPDNSFDAYTVAFGIRNVADIPQALRESFRVLKPGGIFMCLEFSHVQNPLLESAYHWYSFNIIPVIGQLIAGDWKSYQYLVESIKQFPEQKEFAEMMKCADYQLVKYENLMDGIAAIHTGFKNT